MAAFLLFASLGIRIGSHLPDYALLLVNGNAATYTTAPCIIRGVNEEQYLWNRDAVLADREDAALLPSVWYDTKGGIKGTRYRPDPGCRDADGFFEHHRWPMVVFGFVGDRVLEDGTVLW